MGRSSRKLFRTGNPNMHVYNTLKDVYDKMENIIIRPYTAGDEIGMAEVASSIMAVDFYRKLGHDYKNGITSPDEENIQNVNDYRDYSWGIAISIL